MTKSTICTTLGVRNVEKYLFAGTKMKNSTIIYTETVNAVMSRFYVKKNVREYASKISNITGRLMRIFLSVGRSLPLFIAYISDGSSLHSE